MQAIQLVLERAGVLPEQEIVITREMVEAEIARLEAELSRKGSG